MGYTTWVHRRYEHVFPSVFLIAGKTQLPLDFDYTVVKFNSKTNAISFIESPDFDTADEPLVGKALRVCAATRKVKTTRASRNPLIYHHKWLMVPDNYLGFDVQRSKRRSARWKAIIGVNKEISSRIGRRNYWNNVIVPKLVLDDFARSAKTAMTRKAISRPTRFLLEQGCIQGFVLHHGCGKAAQDSKAIRAEAISYLEYDPAHSLDNSALRERYSTIVSNYVMNTLPKEARQRVWRTLAGCTGGNTYITIRQDKIKGTPFQDGFLTAKKTFQVFIPEADFIDEAKEFFSNVEVFHRNSSLLMLRCSN